MPRVRDKSGEITFTEKELQEAIKQEREECALICHKMAKKEPSLNHARVMLECYEAIRGKE